MASFVFHNWQAAIQAGTKLWGTDAFKAKVLMTGTDVTTKKDADELADITLDECDGNGYTPQPIDTPAVNDDDTGDSVQLDALDVTFGTIAAGTRSSKGVLIYDDTDSGDMPAIWIEFGSPIAHDGTLFAVSWASDGIAKLSC